MTGSAFHAMDVSHDEFMRRRGGGLEEGAGRVGDQSRLADDGKRIPCDGRWARRIYEEKGRRFGGGGRAGRRPPEAGGFANWVLGGQVASLLALSWLMLGSCWLQVGFIPLMTSQDASRWAPRRLKIALCWLKLASRRPKWPPEASKMPQKCLGKASR